MRMRPAACGSRGHRGQEFTLPCDLALIRAAISSTACATTPISPAPR